MTQFALGRRSMKYMRGPAFRRCLCAMLLLVVVFCYLFLMWKELRWHFSNADTLGVVVFPSGIMGDPVEVEYYRPKLSSIRILDAYSTLYGCVLKRRTTLSGSMYGVRSRRCSYSWFPQLEGADPTKAEASDLIEQVSFFFAEQYGFETGGSVESWKLHSLADVTERYEFTIEDQMRALLAAPKTPMQEFLWRYSYARRESWSDGVEKLIPFWLLLLLVVIALWTRKPGDIGKLDTLTAIPMALLFLAQHKTFWLVQSMIHSWQHGGFERNLPFSLLTLGFLVFWLLLLGVLTQIPGPFRNVWVKRCIYAGSVACLLWAQQLIYALDSPLASSALLPCIVGSAICVFLILYPERGRQRCTSSDTADTKATLDLHPEQSR